MDEDKTYNEARPTAGANYPRGLAGATAREDVSPIFGELSGLDREIDILEKTVGMLDDKLSVISTEKPTDSDSNLKETDPHASELQLRVIIARKRVRDLTKYISRIHGKVDL